MSTPPPEHPRSKGGSAHGRQISARRVRDLISASIRDGYIAPDTPLAEEDLMELFNTSRGSVRAALSQLRDTGFVERRPRVGTKVSHMGVVVPLTDILSDTGHVLVEVTEDRLVPSFPLVRERLSISDDTVHMVENVFVTGEEVIGLRTAYFSVHLDFDPRYVGPISMAKVIGEMFHSEPGDVLVTIGSDSADAHTAKILGVSEGQHLIVRELTYYSAGGDPIQTVFDRFRGDRVRLESTAALS